MTAGNLETEIANAEREIALLEPTIDYGGPMNGGYPATRDDETKDIRLRELQARLRRLRGCQWAALDEPPWNEGLCRGPSQM